MAQFIFKIPDTQVNRVLNGFANVFDYQTQITDPNDSEAQIPNPENKRKFAQRHIRKFIQSIVKQSEVNTSVKVARKTAIDVADVNIT